VKIKTLYEDKDILAIDKPAGVSVHPVLGDDDVKKSKKEETISDWFSKKYPKSKNVGESIFKDGKEIKKPGIVHRLDKETSGVLLLAKNQKTYEFLKNQFKNREIKKTYHAVVSGFVKNDHATINKPIGRSPKDFRRHLSGRGVRGELREAVTEYRVLKRFTSPEKFTYLEIHPQTGRTHQIRVHMKFINHPVAHDDLYNPGKPYPKDFKRLALHALSIEFKDTKGKIIKIESPLPKEFKKVLK
jgi:23S rRNA pseudouridine1911/1915/1917 synthase